MYFYQIKLLTFSRKKVYAIRAIFGEIEKKENQNSQQKIAFFFFKLYKIVLVIPNIKGI